MSQLAELTPDTANAWRLESPGSAGWRRSPRPDAARKYFMVSADSHITPPRRLMAERIDPKYRDRLPRIERRDEDGAMFLHIEGGRPSRIVDSQLTGEDAYRAKAGEIGVDAEADMRHRIADLDADGIDAELVFPNGPAIGAYWTPDAHFAQAQFRIYNDWAAELTAPYKQRVKCAACVATGDVASAVEEIQRAARLGFDVVSLPSQPVPGPAGENSKYNQPAYDPIWAAIQDCDLTLVIHVATAGDPRVSRGPGGAVMNRAKSHDSVVDPLVALCASGILDRYPKLRFAIVEAGIGWVPSLLDLMDESYRKHHMWVTPKLKHGLPSDYFRQHGAATFQEDRSGLLLVEDYELEENFCWANDYPHQEGTFPHSAEAIEREMGGLKESTREKILGLNSARLFKFAIPAPYRD